MSSTGPGSDQPQLFALLRAIRLRIAAPEAVEAGAADAAAALGDQAPDRTDAALPDTSESAAEASHPDWLVHPHWPSATPRPAEVTDLPGGRPRQPSATPSPAEVTDLPGGRAHWPSATPLPAEVTDLPGAHPFRERTGRGVPREAPTPVPAGVDPRLGAGVVRASVGPSSPRPPVRYPEPAPAESGSSPTTSGGSGSPPAGPGRAGTPPGPTGPGNPPPPTGVPSTDGTPPASGDPQLTPGVPGRLSSPPGVPGGAPATGQVPGGPSSPGTSAAGPAQPLPDGSSPAGGPAQPLPGGRPAGGPLAAGANPTAPRPAPTDSSGLPARGQLPATPGQSGVPGRPTAAPGQGLPTGAPGQGLPAAPGQPGVPSRLMGLPTGPAAPGQPVIPGLPAALQPGGRPTDPTPRGTVIPGNPTPPGRPLPGTEGPNPARLPALPGDRPGAGPVAAMPRTAGISPIDGIGNIPGGPVIRNTGHPMQGDEVAPYGSTQPPVRPNAVGQAPAVGAALPVDGMNPADGVALLEVQRLLSNSLSLAGGPGDVAGRLRAALMQAQPQLLAALPGSPLLQREQLAAALTWLVHNLQDPPLVAAGCAQLGAALAECGVVPQQLHLIGAALAEAMRAGLPGGVLRQDFDNAWRGTWQRVHEWITHGEAMPDYQPTRWTAVVVTHDLRRHDLAIVRLRPYLPMPFRPGQYARIEVPRLPGIWRPYSLAGAPRRDNVVELHVRAKTLEGVSGTLVHHTQVGDKVRLARSEGFMGLPQAPARDLLLIAGDTGVAPLKALLTELAATGDPRSAVLFWGVRNLDELYDIEEVSQIARACKRATVIPVISEGSPGPYASGLVTDAVAAYGEWSESEVYLAGPPVMLVATRSELQRLGVDPARIHFDPPEG